MTNRADPNHTRALSTNVGVEALAGERTLAELGHQFDAHPDQFATWRTRLLDGAAGDLGDGGAQAASRPAADLKPLHAKIGLLALENEILVGALTEAGMLRARK